MLQSVHILQHLRQRHVGGNRLQTILFQNGFDLFRAFAEQTGELNALIAHFGHLGQRAFKIRLHGVSDRI